MADTHRPRLADVTATASTTAAAGTAYRLGYARVSTADQSPASQLDALNGAGCHEVFVDHASGTTTDRPALSRLLERLRPGDTLVVWRLDRLGRSTAHLIDTVTGLGERGIGFCSLTEALDTTTPAGRLLFGILASLQRLNVTSPSSGRWRGSPRPGPAAGWAGGRRR